MRKISRRNNRRPKLEVSPQMDCREREREEEI
jgi:hypothetical protein